MAKLLAESDPNSATRAWRILVALGVVAVTFVTFAPTLEMDFVFWDDDINVYDNAHIRGLTTENLRWMFQDVDQALRYKPLSWLTWAGIFEAGGLSPFGYHLANVVFHALNTGLVFLVLSALVRAARHDVGSDAKGTAIACGLGALIWGLHPLRVEPVAWVTGLPYGQALFFMLLSLICYLRATSATLPRQRLYHALSVILFVLALLTYPIVIGFIGVLIIIDWYPLRRFGADGLKFSAPAVRQVLIEKIPFAAAGILFLAVNLYGRLHTVESSGFVAPTLDQFGFLHRIMQGFYVWTNYLWRQWWPFELSPFYTRLIEFKPTDTAFVASMALVLVVTGFTYFQRRVRPVLLAVWVSYLALLVPALGLTDHPHFAADRYGIIAGICWSALITVALVHIKRNRLAPAIAASTAVALVIGLYCLTARQIPIWRDTVTLCEDTIGKLQEPRFRALFHKRLAVFYIKRGDYALARQELARVAEVNPRLAASAYSLMAESLVDGNQRAEAVEAYAASLRLGPANMRVRYELALLLAKSGRLVEAEQHYTELQRQANGTVPPQFEATLLEALAASYAAVGRMQDAYLRALKAVQLAERDKQSTNLVRLSTNLEQYRQALHSRPNPQ